MPMDWWVNTLGNSSVHHWVWCTRQDTLMVEKTYHQELQLAYVCSPN